MRVKYTPVKPFGCLIEPEQPGADIRTVDIDDLKKSFHEHNLIVLRGFKSFEEVDDFATYCQEWGEVSEWPFGKVLELVEHDNPADHIFDNNYVPMHWDGMYRPQVPEYQIFHCARAPFAGQGGRTTFSHTPMVLKHAVPELVSLWEKVQGNYQRQMEFYNSKTVSPIIIKHPYKEYSVIRYNEPPSQHNGHFVNPPTLVFEGVSVDEEKLLHASLKKALYAPNNFYAHEWQTGDIVVADNFTLLHGREAFQAKSPRHLRRVHVLSNPAYDNPGLESYA